jgi:hypothetical protein
MSKKDKIFYFVYKGVEMGNMRRGRRYWFAVRRDVLEQRCPTFAMKLAHIRRVLHSMEFYGTIDPYKFMMDLIRHRLSVCDEIGIKVVGMTLNPVDLDYVKRVIWGHTYNEPTSPFRSVELMACEDVQFGDIEIIA